MTTIRTGEPRSGPPLPSGAAPLVRGRDDGPTSPAPGRHRGAPAARRRCPRSRGWSTCALDRDAPYLPIGDHAIFAMAVDAVGRARDPAGRLLAVRLVPPRADGGPTCWPGSPSCWAARSRRCPPARWWSTGSARRRWSWLVHRRAGLAPALWALRRADAERAHAGRRLHPRLLEPPPAGAAAPGRGGAVLDRRPRRRLGPAAGRGPDVARRPEPRRVCLPAVRAVTAVLVGGCWSGRCGTCGRGTATSPPLAGRCRGGARRRRAPVAADDRRAGDPDTRQRHARCTTTCWTAHPRSRPASAPGCARWPTSSVGCPPTWWAAGRPEGPFVPEFWPPVAIAVGLVAFAVTMALAVRRRSGDVLWLGTFTLAVAAAGVAAVARIDGPPYRYLVQWTVVIGILAWTTVGAGLLPALGAALRSAADRGRPGCGRRRRCGRSLAARWRPRRSLVAAVGTGRGGHALDRRDRRARAARGGGPRGPRPARAAHGRTTSRSCGSTSPRPPGRTGSSARCGPEPGSCWHSSATGVDMQVIDRSGAPRSGTATSSGRARPATSPPSPTPTGRRRRPSPGSGCSPSRASSRSTAGCRRPAEAVDRADHVMPLQDLVQHDAVDAAATPARRAPPLPASWRA